MKLRTIPVLAVSVWLHRRKVRKAKEQNFNEKLLGDLEYFTTVNKDYCKSPSCGYNEPHAHGFACDKGCMCRALVTKMEKKK
jgi:hypothetical protein